MNIKQFLSMGDEETISSQQASELNAALSAASVNDIPADRRADVLDYLLTALNMNSVQLDLVSKLDFLVENLQSSDRTQK